MYSGIKEQPFLNAARLAAFAFAGPVLAHASTCPDPAVIAKSATAGPSHLYVNGATGVDYPAGGGTCGASVSTACKNPWRALGLAGPGTTIHLLPTTTYTAPIYISSLMGAPGLPVTILGEGAPPNRTKLHTSTGNAIMIDGMPKNPVDNRPIAPSCAAYITIKNLDIRAAGHSSTSPYQGIYVKNGHHIQIEDNVIHDSAGAGVSTHWSDWLNIERNVVYNNALDTTGGIFTSGISIFQSKDIDTQTGSKINIVGNVVYANKNSCNGSCQTLDGNGIIIDDARQTQNVGGFPASDIPPPYAGLTNIYNNVVYGNGGRGIHLYRSNNISVFSNTVRRNQTDSKTSAVYQGDIMAVESGGFKIWSNISVSDEGARAPSTPPRTADRKHYPVSIINHTYSTAAISAVDHNVVWDSASPPQLSIYLDTSFPGLFLIGTHNQSKDPKFKAAGNNPPDFRVLAGSPALGFPVGGSNGLQSYMYASLDILLATRPSMTGGTSPTVTAGAYQAPTN